MSAELRRQRAASSVPNDQRAGVSERMREGGAHDVYQARACICDRRSVCYGRRRLQLFATDAAKRGQAAAFAHGLLTMQLVLNWREGAPNIVVEARPVGAQRDAGWLPAGWWEASRGAAHVIRSAWT